MCLVALERFMTSQRIQSIPPGGCKGGQHVRKILKWVFYVLAARGHANCSTTNNPRNGSHHEGRREQLNCEASENEQIQILKRQDASTMYLTTCALVSLSLPTALVKQCVEVYENTYQSEEGSACEV